MIINSLLESLEKFFKRNALSSPDIQKTTANYNQYFDWPTIPFSNKILQEKFQELDTSAHTSKSELEKLGERFSYNNMTLRYSNYLLPSQSWKYDGIKRFNKTPSINGQAALKIKFSDSPILSIDCNSTDLSRSVHVGQKVHTHLKGPDVQIYHDLKFTSQESMVNIVHGSADMIYLCKPPIDPKREHNISNNDYIRKNNLYPSQVWIETQGVYAIAATATATATALVLENPKTSEDSPQILFEIRPASTTASHAATVIAGPNLAVIGNLNINKFNEYHSAFDLSKEQFFKNSSNNSQNIFKRMPKKDVNRCWRKSIPIVAEDYSNGYKKNAEYTQDSYFGLLGGEYAVNDTKAGLEIFGKNLLLGAHALQEANKNYTSQLELDQDGLALRHTSPHRKGNVVSILHVQHDINLQAYRTKPSAYVGKPDKVSKSSLNVSEDGIKLEHFGNDDTIKAFLRMENEILSLKSKIVSLEADQILSIGAGKAAITLEENGNINLFGNYFAADGKKILLG